ncbi:MAG: Gfo/Idh/MocA family oxidoreductase [Planctomycetes bacterium]|nr:Gfo/Idh/MocA family oxidoreductase [Planctomycetota bacterium]
MSVKMGLIGYGAWGAHHARAILAAPGAELTAICGHSESSAARARADHPGVPIFQDYHEFLAQADVDAVSVVVPNDLHFRVAHGVLESGRHLLLEKPMTLAIADCQALIDLARERQRILAVGHELRMSSQWGHIQELIAAGTVGEPLSVLIELWRRPYRTGSDGWRYDIQRVGDWILEEPIHFFDLARWYFQGIGNPVSIYATGNGKRSDHPELHDNFSAVMHFPHGRYAVVVQTLAGWEHHQTIKLTGTSGALWSTWSGAVDRTFQPTCSLKLQTGDTVQEIALARPSGEAYELVEEVGMFVQAIATESAVRCTGEDGLWSVAMCLKAAESLQSGQVVRF